MIMSDLNQLNTERFSSTIEEVLNHLRNTDFSGKEAGEYQLNGERVYVMIQVLMTEAKSARRLEAHNAYIDIHYIVKGEELFGFCRKNKDVIVDEDRLEERDIVFFKDSADEMNIIVREGQFVIFYPNDLHRPCCYVDESREVKKVVVKIRVDMLKEF